MNDIVTAPINTAFTSYNDFLATSRAVKDLGEELKEETLLGVRGFLFMDQWWIQYSARDNEYRTMLGRCEYIGGIEEVTSRLYLYVAGEEGWDEC